MNIKFIFGLFLLFSASLTAYAAEWELDKSHSGVYFSVKHLGISNVKGEFTNFEVKVTGEKETVEKSEVFARIYVDSINTREPKRDEHLKSADFFDVMKYPYIEFRSKKITKVSETKLRLTGDLTMHGVTKEISMDVESPGYEIVDPWGKTRAGFNAKTTINRKDFGINWNKTLDKGGLVVGNEVDIIIELELIRKTNK